MLRIGAMRPNPTWLLTNPSRLTPLSNLSPNTDPGRITVAASEAFQTSSRQLNLNDAFGTLALVRDDQGQSGDHALSMRMRAVSVSMISEFGAGVTLI